MQTPVGSDISNGENTRRARWTEGFEHHGPPEAAFPRYNISPTTTRGGRTVYIFPGNTDPVPNGSTWHTRAHNRRTPTYGNTKGRRRRRRDRAPEAGSAQGERKHPTRVNKLGSFSDDSECSDFESSDFSPDSRWRSKSRSRFNNSARWKEDDSESLMGDASEEEDDDGEGRNHDIYSLSGEETLRDSSKHGEEQSQYRGRERRRRQRPKNRRISSSPEPRNWHKRASEPEEEPPEDFYAILGLSPDATADE